jgi:hypothetical protein
LRDNHNTPAVSASALYNSGSTLYFGGNTHLQHVPIAPKQLQIMTHNFADTNLTTKHYLPFNDAGEQPTSNSFISTVNFITPADCRLKKVIWSPNAWNGDTNVSMSLETCPAGGSNFNGGDIETVGQVTVAYDHSEQANHTILMDFENDLDPGVGDQTNIVRAGNRLLIGMVTEDDVQVGSGNLIITSVWEIDYSTLITGSTA